MYSCLVFLTCLAFVCCYLTVNMVRLSQGRLHCIVGEKKHLNGSSVISGRLFYV